MDVMLLRNVSDMKRCQTKYYFGVVRKWSISVDVTLLGTRRICNENCEWRSTLEVIVVNFLRILVCLLLFRPFDKDLLFIFARFYFL